MDKQAIQQKAADLEALLVRYRGELGTLEKELLAAIADYHAALKEEKLRELKESMIKNQ